MTKPSMSRQQLKKFLGDDLGAIREFETLFKSVNITLEGDVTGEGLGTVITTIAPGAVTLSKMADLPGLSIIGNDQGDTATPQALTADQVTALLNLFSDVLQGLVPASGGGGENYLRADGAWEVPPAAGPAGGDLTGTYPDPQIGGIMGEPIPALADGLLKHSDAGWEFSVSAGEATGFTDPPGVIETYDSAARTVTLTGNVKAFYVGKLIPDLVSGWASAPHPAINGPWFLFYDGENFVWQQTPWAFDKVQICFVNYGASSKFALRECHGLMQWESHKEFHETVGTYRNSGGDVSAYVAGSTTATDRRPAVSATVVNDEDLQTTIPALTAGPYTLATLTGAGTSTFTTGSAEIIPVVGAAAYYNQFTGGAWVQTPLGGNEYGAAWLIAIPASADAGSQAYRYLWMQGQKVSSTLLAAEAWNAGDLDLGQLSAIATEFVIIAKVIIRATAPGTNWSITSVTNLTGTRVNSSATPGGTSLSVVTATAPLTGLGTVSTPLAITEDSTHRFATDAEKATWNTVTLKAADTAVVHNTGTETVAGAKTFTSFHKVTGAFANSIYGPTSWQAGVYGTDAPAVDGGAAIALGGRTGLGTDQYPNAYMFGGRESLATYAGYWELYTTSGGDRAGEANSASYRRVRVDSQGRMTVFGPIGINGAAPPAKPVLNAAAVDPATTMALVNQIRAALISYGFCS